jgi:hypothetical protein
MSTIAAAGQWIPYFNIAPEEKKLTSAPRFILSIEAEVRCPMGVLKC